MKIEANMFCLLMEINQLSEIKLMQEGWTEVLYFATNLVFNFHFPSILLCTVILQNWKDWYIPLV